MPVQSQLHRRFCAAIRARRIEIGLTQVEVARRLGVSQPYYAGVERGRSSPSIDVLERVAAALECDPVDLLSREKIPA